MSNPIDFSQLTLADIRRRLSNAPPVPTDEPYPPGVLKEPLRLASVLIPLLLREDIWHILFIRRAEHSEDLHSGQVAFPGGGAHAEDPDPETTALREAHEEIGVNPADVQIAGRLNEFITISSYRVTPIVGVVPWPYSYHPDHVEVSRIFTIPLNWLADPVNHTVQERLLPYPYKPIPVIYFKPYDGEILWGASARFTLGLISLLSVAE
jgi:8-oxo-dGTP pyrophosphatase MutT (NUDIX family)